MLLPRLTNCPECANIPSLLRDIDCKLAEHSNSMYNNMVYMLNNTISHTDMLQLIAYKRILTYKYYNPSYLCNYSVNSLVGKIKRLTAGCISKCNEPIPCESERCNLVN
jgi:hypothetical protein